MSTDASDHGQRNEYREGPSTHNPLQRSASSRPSSTTHVATFNSSTRRSTGGSSGVAVEPHSDDDPSTVRISSSGVPIDSGDLVVGRGSSHECIFSKTTLRDGMERGTLWYYTKAVEHDFVAFANRGRVSFFAYCMYDIFETALILGVGLPFAKQGIVPRLGAQLVLLVAGTLVSDSVVRMLKQRFGVAHPMTRAMRARVFEVLVSLELMAYTIALSLTDVADPSMTFCAPYNITTGMQQPVLTEQDFPPVDSGLCLSPSNGDGGGVIVFALLLTGRLIVQGTAIALCAALVIFTQMVNVFDVTTGYYNVSRAEYGRRAIMPLASMIVCIVVTAVVEKRSRERFEAAVGGATTILHRSRTLRQLAALKRRLIEQTSDALGGRVADAGGGSESGGPSLFAQLAMRSDSTATGFRTVLVCDVVNTRRLGLDGTEELAAHFDALQALLMLADAPPTVRTWVFGDSITAVGAATLRLPPLYDDDDEDAPEYTLDEEEVLDIATRYAVDVCTVASRLRDGVSRVGAVFANWSAARIAVVGGISHGLITWDPSADSRIETSGAVFRTARTLARSAAQDRIMIARPTMQLVRDEFTSTGIVEVDGSDVCVLGMPRVDDSDGSSAAASTVPWPPRESDAASFVAQSLTAATLTLDTITQEPGGERLDLQLARVGGCCCCREAGCMRFCFPRFAEADVEEQYQEHDHEHSRLAFVALCVSAIVALLALTLLIAVEPTSSDVVAAVVLCFVLVFIFAAAATFVVVSGTVLRAPARTILCMVIVASVVAFTYVMWAAGHRFALWSSENMAGMPAFTMLLVLPDVTAIRYTVMLGWYSGLLAVINLKTVGPGREKYALGSFVACIFGALVLIVLSRRHRAQYGDTHYLNMMRLELHDARTAMDRALEDRLPPFCTARLRADPDGPLCRAFALPAATVVVIDINPAMYGHFHSPLDNSQNREGSGMRPPGLAVPHSAASTTGSVATPPPEGEPSTAGAAPRATAEAPMFHARNAFQRIFPGCFVCVQAGRVVVAAVAEGEALEALRQLITAQAVGTGVIRVAGVQPVPTPQPLYNVPDFPPNSHAVVRVGMHRAPLVVGLMGARQYGFSFFGPALDGAWKLSSLSLSLGTLVVSADADWQLRTTDDVPGIGPVAALSLAVPGATPTPNYAGLPSPRGQDSGRLGVVWA